MHPGDRVLAIGNPTGSSPAAGSGQIAAEGRRVEVPGGYVIDDLFETDAVIEPASSGGPLVGADGRVIGVTARLEDDTGYAVPANMAREVVAQLDEHHKVVRPFIGVRAHAVRDGVELVYLHEGGPAAGAGLQTGDVVVAVDGVDVRTVGGLFAEVERHTVGDSVELQVERDGTPMEATVRLDERPATLPAG